MNPNAKEFVPAHILRKRQDEAASAMGSLTKQLGDVDLEESRRVGEGETSGDTQQNSTGTSSTSDDRTQNQPSSEDGGTNHQSSADLNKETEPTSSDQHCHRAQHNPYNNQNNERSKNNHETNGDSPQDLDEDDRYLLKAGENYCEFNGEQFIIPGDDEEYENELPGSDNSHPGYDFGNAEDNEDEDVINAYDAFLSELP